MKSFQEHTITFFGTFRVWDNKEKQFYMDELYPCPVLMVDTDEEETEIYRVYTYVDCLDGIPKKWWGSKSKNPLFRNLNKAFINEFRSQLFDAISDQKED